MKKLHFKSSITIEASIIVSLIVYIILFLVDTALFFCVDNLLTSGIIRKGLKVQNYYECGSDLQTGNIHSMNADINDDTAKQFIDSELKSMYFLGDVSDVSIKKTLSNIEISVDIIYGGIVLPYKGLKLKREVRLSYLTPADDIRINKEINYFRE